MRQLWAITKLFDDCSMNLTGKAAREQAVNVDQPFLPQVSLGFDLTRLKHKVGVAEFHTDASQGLVQGLSQLRDLFVLP